MIHAGGASLQLALRPSRRLRAAIIALGLIAGTAVHLSHIPDACLVLLPALVWVAWRGLSRLAGETLVLRADGSVGLIGPDGGERVAQARALHERGPLGVLVLAVDERERRWAFAGDSLPAASRRELRLWMRDHAPLRDAAVARALPSGQTTSPG